MVQKRFRFGAVHLWMVTGVVLALMLQGCAAPHDGGHGTDVWSRLNLAARTITLPAEKPNHGRVVCFAEVRYRDIQFVKTDDGYEAVMEYTFSLYSEHGREPLKLSDRKKVIRVGTFQETLDRQKTVRVIENFEVPFGEYTARVVARDRNARSMGIANEHVEVVDLYHQLYVSRPILMWDSVSTLDAEKMVPFQNRRYDRDVFALVVVGGINPNEFYKVHYRLEDTRGEMIYERTLNLRPRGRVNFVSLRIPVSKLALGKTHVVVSAEQFGTHAVSRLTIFSSLGRGAEVTQGVDSYIEPMRYIMPSDEWNRLRDADPETRKKLFEEFWKKRDPDPNDDVNPLMEEFFFRVQEANQKFSWGSQEGWETDRGRIYIIYGPPDSIERQRSPRTGITYEIWRYYNIGRQFVFEDRYSNGNFRLYSSN